jgi:hypothetical protein
LRKWGNICDLRHTPVTTGKRDGGGSLLILSLYGFIICLVAAVLYVAVNNLEPNRRYASALKIVIITLAVVAFLAHLMR